MKKKIFLSMAVAMSLAATSTFAMKPITITEQGSFMAGGKVITAAGTYNGFNDFKDLSGNTLHGDNAYCFYQIPKKAKKLSMVFLHGYGQSGKS